jgi:ribosome-binding protein aMBF1 (putative translation factor)
MREPTPAAAPVGHAGQPITAAAAPASWRGVLRRGGRRVWSCRHHHDSTAQARTCAEQELRTPGSSELGLRLRELRRAAGLTIQQVAQELECSQAKVSRLENAQVRATPRDVRDMLALYGVTGQTREALIRAAREARRLGVKASPPDRGPREPGR